MTRRPCYQVFLRRRAFEMCFTLRRHRGRGLSSGTSPERIAPESLTPMLSAFVHRNISRRRPVATLDQARLGRRDQILGAQSLTAGVEPSGQESTGFRRSRRIHASYLSQPSKRLNRIWFSPPPAKRWGGVGGGGSIRRNRCFGERRATPHPRPLPATRDARGGRGAYDLILSFPGSFNRLIS